VSGSPAAVAAILRASDRQRYLASLFQPEPHRPAVQALFAFNAEVATIRDRVRDPTAGEIRLRWWRDALSGTRHGDVERSPVAAALFAALDHYAIPSEPLIRLVDARRFDLYNDPMPDIATFEGYAGETNSVLYQLNLAILAGGVIPTNGDAAGHLGVAHALIGHLLAFGDNARRGHLFLPLEVFRAAGADVEDTLRAPQPASVSTALGLLAELADEHLAKADAAIRLMPVPLRAAIAPLPVLRATLRSVRRGKSAPPADWRQLALMGAWLLRQRQAPAI
jgi:phytoene synthase